MASASLQRRCSASRGLLPSAAFRALAAPDLSVPGPRPALGHAQSGPEQGGHLSESPRLSSRSPAPSPLTGGGRSWLSHRLGASQAPRHAACPAQTSFATVGGAPRPPLSPSCLHGLQPWRPSVHCQLRLRVAAPSPQYSFAVAPAPSRASRRPLPAASAPRPSAAHALRDLPPAPVTTGPTPPLATVRLQPRAPHQAEPAPRRAQHAPEQAPLRVPPSSRPDSRPHGFQHAARRSRHRCRSRRPPLSHRLLCPG
eukprot:3227308-Prymnesium_polylepis.3